MAAKRVLDMSKEELQFQLVKAELRVRYISELLIFRFGGK